MDRPLRQQLLCNAYFQGNVVIRTFGVDSLGRRNVDHTFRAKEMYYEVAQSRAIGPPPVSSARWSFPSNQRGDMVQL